jgi:type I restriction enzyme S subunit
VDEDPDPVAFPDTLIRVRPDEGQINPRFLSLIWNSRYVRRQIEASARTTAGIYKVNQATLAGVSIPVPPLADQDRIVGELTMLESELRRLSVEIETAGIRAAQLRIALLAEAFSGRLVGQDPADEPAAELLARIRAERAVTKSRQSTPRRRVVGVGAGPARGRIKPDRLERAGTAPTSHPDDPSDHSPRTRKEPATRVTGDDYEQGALPL